MRRSNDGPRWLVAAVAVLAMAAPARAAPRVDPGVSARAAAGEPVRVLVELDTPYAPEGALPEAARGLQRRGIAAAQAALAAVLDGTPHRVVRAFRAVPFAALEVDAASLAALAHSPRVVRVVADDLHAPSLDGSVPRVEADQMVALGLDGSGRTIVVVDTGVDGGHPNLAGKVVAEACFASGPPGPTGDCPNGEESQSGSPAGVFCAFSADCFHGTHVAGIALGDGPSYDGVATGADLVSIRVASEVTSASSCSPSPAPCARAFESDVIAALEEVYEVFHESFPIAAVNVSLGGSTYTSQAACDADNAAYKAAIDNLRSVDVATVISSGNNSATNAISEPACISSAVSVGATNDQDGPTGFTNAAAFLSLWAPGFNITAPYYETTLYVPSSGTSMAAPHVSGAWAILQQALGGGGSVDEILDALRTTGQPVSHPTASTTRIRIRAAFDSLTIACDDGVDDDGDGLVDLVDPGCADAADDSERGDLVCDDDEDQDGDGFFDFPDDPGCGNAYSGLENPKCQDGLDNDGDGGTDFDGGASLNGGVPFDEPDSYCDHAWKNREKPSGSCGLGFELAPLLALLRVRRRRT